MTNGQNIRRTQEFLEKSVSFPIGISQGGAGGESFATASILGCHFLAAISGIISYLLVAQTFVCAL